MGQPRTFGGNTHFFNRTCQIFMLGIEDGSYFQVRWDVENISTDTIRLRDVCWDRVVVAVRYFERFKKKF
jgi:hypothetical protein